MKEENVVSGLVSYVYILYLLIRRCFSSSSNNYLTEIKKYDAMKFNRSSAALYFKYC